MKFTDTFINSFNDGFVQLYVGTISIIKTILKDYQ